MGFFSGTNRAAETSAPEPPETPAVPERAPAQPEPRRTTVLAQGITVLGAVKGEGVVQVEGAVEGQIDLDGQVIVTPTGQVRGPIEARAVQVAGSVAGNVLASDQLRLERTGAIDGNLTTSSLIVEDGGWLNGSTSMFQRDEILRARRGSAPLEEEEDGAQDPAPGLDLDLEEDTEESEPIGV